MYNVEDTQFLWLCPVQCEGKFYRFCEVSYYTFMCKRFLQSTTINKTTIVRLVDDIEDEDKDDNNQANISDSDDGLIEPYMIDDFGTDNCNGIIDDDNDVDDMGIFDEEMYGKL